MREERKEEHIRMIRKRKKNKGKINEKKTKPRTMKKNWLAVKKIREGVGDLDTELFQWMIPLFKS